jgi:hypothetical protein
MEDDEEIMVTRRRRFKQTTSLAHRLIQEVGRLRDRARSLSPGPEQAELWLKVKQAETALRIDEWLAAPGAVSPPDHVMPLMRKSPKKRSPDGSAQEST